MITSSLVKTILMEVGLPVKSMFSSQSGKEKAEAKFRELLIGLTESELKIKRAIVLSETTGDKLQRSWRPCLMFTFIFLMIFHAAIVPLHNAYMVPLWLEFFGVRIGHIDTAVVWEAIPGQLWTFLTVAIGGYIGARSWEKVRSAERNNQTTVEAPIESREIPVNSKIDHRYRPEKPVKVEDIDTDNRRMVDVGYSEYGEQ